MKETIKYYYNINPVEITEIDDGCYFFFNDFKFYFVKFKRDIKEIDILVKISNDLYEKNILVDTFMLSKDNKFYVVVDEDIFVMLRVNSIENDICSLKDIVYFNDLLIFKDINKISGNWALLWMKKVDDFEQEIAEINTEFPLIQESSSYFIGLAENAISYFNDTLNEEDIKDTKINLNHKRIYSKVYSGYINNPLTFTFDYEVRDIAEYIKSKFFEGVLDYSEIEDLIYEKEFSRVSYRMLFSRLLYPSYYFDAIKKIFVFDYSEDIICKYINKVNEYEDFLIDIYNIINRKINIPSVEWISNKD